VRTLARGGPFQSIEDQLALAEAKQSDSSPQIYPSMGPEGEHLQASLEQSVDKPRGDAPGYGRELRPPSHAINPTVPIAHLRWHVSGL
jgi:hypothetical protein